MEEGEGSSGVGKYYVGSVRVCDDSYQRRWLVQRAAAMNSDLTANDDS